MSSPALAGLKKTFPLDPSILGAGSAVALELSGTTDADVLSAVIGNEPFPDRPVIDLGHINLTATSGEVKFDGAGTTLGVGFSAGVTAAAAIYHDARAAIAALNLGQTPGLNITIGAPAGSRFALLRAGYTASGNVSGSHPIGAVGSFTFGASAAAAGLTAVIHRFPATAKAADVLKDTVSSWKLPVHLQSAGQLQPATWVVTEASGSLAVNLGAKLGYDFSFVRQAKKFGLSGDIGLKIDAAATAAFGFDVSGRFLIAVGRESDNPADTKLRLQMFKLSSNGVNFGLNLKFGVTGVATILPNKADDFVAAVFGVHGAQIVNLLGKIEQWTDPNTDVGELVAGLVKEKALELIRDVTGIDPRTAFEAARAKLLSAIHLYQSLPERVSSELLGVLNGLSAPATADLIGSLQLLAAPDEASRKTALANLLNATGFAASPAGRLITALGDNGLLNLFDRLPELRGTSTTILSILNGGEIAKLQAFINKELHLDKVIAAVTQNDFDSLDSLLRGRLSQFFNKTLHFEDLQEVRTAIHAVIAKRDEVYAAARKALNSRYGAEVTAAWQRTTSDTAVIDAEFDLSDPAAQALFQAVMKGTGKAIDAFLTTQIPSVHLNFGVLTHEMTSRRSLAVSLPFFNFQTDAFTTALAKVTASGEDGRVLIYDVSGKDEVAVRNKFNSSLTVTIANLVARPGVAANFPDLRTSKDAVSTWTYRLLYSKAKMKREELEAITRPFLEEHMAAQFSGATTQSAWYNMLESTSEGLLHNGPEVYGDICAAFEVTYPGEVVGAWLKPQANIPEAAKHVSLEIQRTLKETLLMFYLNDIAKLRDLASVAPLLTWASIPPAFSFDGSVFNASTRKVDFWDIQDINLRRSAALHGQTLSNLRIKLPEFRRRLQEAGFGGTVQFYQDSAASQILAGANSQFGDVLFRSLLTFEARIIDQATEALNEIQDFLPNAATQPTKAKDRLAEFAFDITKAFNSLIGQNVFASLASFRGVAQVVFAEASKALDPTLAATPRAMLTIDILNTAPPRTFNLADFPKGAAPAGTDIAVSQRLVSL